VTLAHVVQKGTKAIQTETSDPVDVVVKGHTVVTSKNGSGDR
jgi:hypothetical protein